MPTFNQATDQAEYELPDPGAYIATCIRIEDAPDKGFGPGAKWVFTLADPKSGVLLHNANGEPVELFQWTSVKMSPKARARPIVEALLGRPLDVDGREVPNVQQLVGKSMSTLVIWEKRDDGSDTARVTSCKPYVSPSTAAVATPSPSSSPTPDRGLLLQRIRSAIKKAEEHKSKNHLDWLAMDVDNLDDDELTAVLHAIHQDTLAD